jgi:hypothetical protein
MEDQYATCGDSRMTHEELLQLLSSKIDGEITPEQQHQLDRYLQENEDARILAEAFQSQDRDLRTAFEPHRNTAIGLVDRVSLQLFSPPTSSASSHSTFFSTKRIIAFFSTAALLLIGIFLWFKPTKPNGDPEVVENNSSQEKAITLLLRPKELPIPPSPDPVNIGDQIVTNSGEKKRFTCPDGSILYLNQNTQCTLLDDRQMKLDRGEIFVEAIPSTETNGLTNFTIQTRTGSVVATGTKFAIETGQKGDQVLVTQGSVRINGLEQPVVAGQLLAPGSNKPQSAPRVSHELDWTRDLMTAAETRLVPEGNYDGGALLAVDPYGQEAKLSLVKYHIDVHIEDGFARTTIDQTYFNHENFQMEGTFYFPLPPDASLSRLAMYVDGNLMEGGMAERDFARQTYERIRYTQRDPALLEWLDGSLFKMRVFPLEARQEKRLILSYTQRLPMLYGRATYRFPTGHSINLVDEWNFQARVVGNEHLQWSSPSHPTMKRLPDSPKSFLVADSAKQIPLKKDVVLEIVDPTQATLQGEQVHWSSSELDGQRYLMIRYRPDLPSFPKKEHRDWVFLFESSGARDPLLARTQVEVIRSLLDHAEHDDTFAVISVGTRVQLWKEDSQPVTPSNIQDAIQFLENRHLIGALNLESGIHSAITFLNGKRNPHLVHLGTGIASLGEQRPDKLIPLIPKDTRYVGIAIGKQFSPQFMKVAAENSGGFFTQINPDESISWRGFELSATLNTPRLMHLEVAASPPNDKVRFLSFTNSLTQGEEFAAITRLAEQPTNDPKEVTVKGILNGMPFEKLIPVRDIFTKADHIPRSWAKLEIDRLLAENSRDNKNRIIELSKQMYVMTPYTSLLVLENEQMYKDFKVDRGRKDHWAMYSAPQKIEVKYIPDPNHIANGNAPNLHGQKPHANQVLQTLLVRTQPVCLTWSNRDSSRDGPILTAGNFPDSTREKFTVSGQTNGTDFDGEFAGHSLAANLYGWDVASSAFSSTPRLRIDELEEAGKRRSRLSDRSFAERLTTAPLGDLDDRPVMEFFLGRERGAVSPVPLELDFDRPTDRWGSKDRLGRNKAIEDLDKPYFDNGFLSRESVYIQQQTMNGRSLGGIAFSRLNPGLFNRSQEHFNFGTIPQDEYRTKLGETLTEGGARSKERLLRSLLRNQPNPPEYYSRLYFNQTERFFTDLPAFAPGMSTLPSDVKAALEAEAAPRFGVRQGTIDPEARKLIDSVRSSGWVRTTIHLPSNDDFSILHDGQGRYLYERKLPFGLIEKVICDGTTLFHLYPELGIGAKRNMSRFHRMDFCSLIPDSLPLVEDLAHGMDVKRISPNTVALVPLRPTEIPSDKIKWLETHLVIENNRLVERKWVEMPQEKLIARCAYEPSGYATLFDKESKTLSESLKCERLAESVPNLKPKLDDLVILPLPLRDRSSVYAKLNLDPNRDLNDGENACFEYLPQEDILQLLAVDWANNQPYRVETIWRRCFANHDDHRLGFFTLMRSAGVDLDHLFQFRSLAK